MIALREQFTWLALHAERYLVRWKLFRLKRFWKRSGAVVLLLDGERCERLTFVETTPLTDMNGVLRFKVSRLARPEVLEWIIANKTADVTHSTTPEFDTLFVFANPDDALAFKLRWF